MRDPKSFHDALKEAKKWGDFYSIISIVLVIGLMSLTAYLGEAQGVDVKTLVGMYLTMIGVIIVVCIWQAAAFAAASIRSSLAVQRNRDLP
ncbi:MAG: hypothetical protein B7Y12_01175 [Rhizobiales bacterium 24-66-13]|jgi:multisubunit Na+/H+ antiporter MnhG subunit|nr:MAG: hypothetical protein B7Z41_07585 [Rhizobiales bacterium 12-66-7]OYZ82981.1 MAG: hypothetical protein B7Y12_01175 [Rhizobiales bacterium 24-66-13]OZB12228.1 MAG: hypothetical protein B7X67_00140 [Rhizobiales bacterium 39-66-18]HQS44921.1 hypothetical protein [Xanthobacteraceae bacterium]